MKIIRTQKASAYKDVLKKDVASLRKAIVLKEILDKPKGRRNR